MNDFQKTPSHGSLPFASYPSEGRALLGRVRGANCRHEYGLRHQRLTGQECCAYCALDFTSCYENWLMMALDHVVPASVCLGASVPIEWMDDHANRVLCCAACNGFKNRWKPTEPLICPSGTVRKERPASGSSNSIDTSAPTKFLTMTSSTMYKMSLLLL